MIRFKFNSLSWQRYSLIIISVFIAVILWAYVNNLQNPLQEQEFRVSLHAAGLPDGMITDELPDRVSVWVKPGLKVRGLKAEDFKAVVDLSHADIGENVLTVNVSGPSGVQISQINPGTITVNVDKLVQKQVPVRAFLKGTPLAGYSTGEPLLVPTAVLASGPSRLLDTIEQVPVTVDVSGAKQNLDYSLPLALQNKQVKLSPEVVRVVVPVNVSVPYKAVPVKVETTGAPNEGYELDSAAAQPAVVQVYAPHDVLPQIKEVSTEPVNLNGAEENLKQSTELQLPPGAVLLQPDRVEVTVTLNEVPQPPEQPQEPEQAE